MQVHGGAPAPLPRGGGDLGHGGGADGAARRRQSRRAHHHPAERHRHRRRRVRGRAGGGHRAGPRSVGVRRRRGRHLRRPAPHRGARRHDAHRRRRLRPHPPADLGAVLRPGGAGVRRHRGGVRHGARRHVSGTLARLLRLRRRLFERRPTRLRGGAGGPPRRGRLPTGAGAVCRRHVRESRRRVRLGRRVLPTPGGAARARGGGGRRVLGRLPRRAAGHGFGGVLRRPGTVLARQRHRAILRTGTLRRQRAMAHLRLGHTLHPTRREQSPRLLQRRRVLVSGQQQRVHGRQRL